jgi:hypothetical protein
MKTEEQRLLEELYDRDSRRTTSVTLTSGSPTIQAYPDAKKHQIVSFIKSGIRILGYILIPFNLFWAAGILVLSEVVGIIEELV